MERRLSAAALCRELPCGFFSDSFSDQSEAARLAVGP